MVELVWDVFSTGSVRGEVCIGQYVGLRIPTNCGNAIVPCYQGAVVATIKRNWNFTIKGQENRTQN